MKVKIKRLILLLLIIVWACLVFGLSNQDGDESSGLSRKIVEIFTKDESTIDLVEPYIRKLAHFSEYGLGGCLFLMLFATYKWTDRRTIITSSILGVWYAISDEAHQLMVAGRNGSLFDVYIDSLGFITGVCAMMALLKIIAIFSNKKKDKKVKRNESYDRI